MRFDARFFSNLFFGLAFLCAIPLMTGKTLGHPTLFRYLFFVVGAIGFILSLISSRSERYKKDFNPLFWVGNLVAFIGLMLKTSYIRYGGLIALAGLALSAISYFFNPVSEKDSEKDLLDR